MAEMTEQKAIDYLRCITEYKGKDVVILLEEHAEEIASLIAAQAAEIAKQQRMVRRAREELADETAESHKTAERKEWLADCWLKWLEQEGEK